MPTYSPAVGMVPLLAVLEGVQSPPVPLPVHSLEEEMHGDLLAGCPPPMEQMALLAWFYSLQCCISQQSEKPFT